MCASILFYSHFKKDSNAFIHSICGTKSYAFVKRIKSISMVAILTRPYPMYTKWDQRMVEHLIRSQESNPSFETLHSVWLCARWSIFKKIFLCIALYPQFAFICVGKRLFVSIRLCLQMDSFVFILPFSVLEYPSFSIVQDDFVLFSLCCESLLWFCYFCFHSVKGIQTRTQVSMHNDNEHNGNSWMKCIILWYRFDFIYIHTSNILMYFTAFELNTRRYRMKITHTQRCRSM